MNAAIVDSSAFYSLENRDEPDHSLARETLEALLGQRVGLATTNFVFDETYTLLLVRLGRRTAVEWGKSLLEGRLIQLIRVGEDHESRAWEIILSFADQDFSYTDATSFAVAESLDIDGAFALDRHFHQFGRMRVVP